MEVGTMENGKTICDKDKESIIGPLKDEMTFTLGSGSMTECTARALTLGRTEVGMRANGGKAGALVVG